jgi:hypothetical protein
MSFVEMEIGVSRERAHEWPGAISFKFRRIRVPLIRASARILPGVPLILADIATIIAVIAAIVPALHSAATGERAQQGDESCKKREAQHGILS